MVRAAQSPGFARAFGFIERHPVGYIFAFRYLPEGSYSVTAFDDVDRDGALDFRETQGSASASLAAGDTLLLDVPMLPSDTTAAVAVTASALDSVTIALEFDDFLDLDAPATDVNHEQSSPASLLSLIALLVSDRCRERNQTRFLDA